MPNPRDLKIWSGGRGDGNRKTDWGKQRLRRTQRADELSLSDGEIELAQKLAFRLASKAG